MSKSDNKITNQKKGRIAESIAQNEFIKRGFDVYASVADDNGVDFVAIYGEEQIYYVQVKSVVRGNYTYIQMSKFQPTDSFLVAYIVFEQGYSNPEMFIIRGTAWRDNQEGPLKQYRYDKDQESTAEYGISYAKKHDEVLKDRYSAEKFFENKQYSMT